MAFLRELANMKPLFDRTRTAIFFIQLDDPAMIGHDSVRSKFPTYSISPPERGERMTQPEHAKPCVAGGLALL